MALPDTEPDMLTGVMGTPTAAFWTEGVFCVAIADCGLGSPVAFTVRTAKL